MSLVQIDYGFLFLSKFLKQVLADLKLVLEYKFA